VKDQSHKDEMSAALRGDFARLRDRGVAVTLAPPAADSTAAPHEAVPVAPPEPEPAADEPPPAPVATTEPEAGADDAPPADEPPASALVATPEPEAEPDAEPERAGGWLDRLLGR
jgi:hypothetical protein